MCVNRWGVAKTRAFYRHMGGCVGCAKVCVKKKTVYFKGKGRGTWEKE